MHEEWISFLEAIHRMTARLLLLDFQAKPLLRSAVASGRVSGRGEHKERGSVLFTRYGENLDNDPDVVREGMLFFKAEVYPGEIALADLRSWMESLAEDDPLQRLRLQENDAPQILSSAAEGSDEPKPRGRRPQYDWEAFGKAALEKLEEEGAFDPSVDAKWNKAALERHMAVWCRDNWDAEPSESTIRSKLTDIEVAYLEGRKGL